MIRNIFFCMLLTGLTMLGEEQMIKIGGLTMDAAKVKELGLTFENVVITIPELKKDYDFLWIADIHVISEDLSEVAEKDMNVVKSRIDKTFRNRHSGKTSLEVWRGLPDVINTSGADGVLLGGDICDFGSLASMRELKAGFERWKVPFLFARADHDTEPWWMSSKPRAEMNELGKAIDGNPDMLVMEFDDLIVAGFNNATSNLTPAGLARFKEIYVKKKPIILVTHVPIRSELDTSLSDECMRRDDQKRDLTWGAKCFYSPNAVTAEFLKLVCADDSPVRAVLAGHLHYRWEGPLTPKIRQYLFTPGFTGNLGVISLRRAQ